MKKIRCGELGAGHVGAALEAKSWGTWKAKLIGLWEGGIWVEGWLTMAGGTEVEGDWKGRICRKEGCRYRGMLVGLVCSCG